MYLHIFLIISRLHLLFYFFFIVKCHWAKWKWRYINFVVVVVVVVGVVVIIIIIIIMSSVINNAD